ncbi:myotubularin-related protein 9-like [Mytilus trossulus]|uniref:myotubularin-related protein 9-like n=1 Tax=Mytilus trossulus TaxID=6551 RepID=UPI0030061EDE
MEFAEFIKTPTVENVCMKLTFSKAVTGTLCITGHHVILSSKSENHEELWLLHSAIDSTEKKMTQSNGKYILILKCKDLQMIELEFNGGDDCLDVASSIENLSHVDDISLKYPFFYRAGFEPLEDGWQTFLPENEYTRFKDCSEEWRLSYVNKDYKSSVVGGGYEPEVCYPQWRRIHQSLDRRQAFHDSLIKLMELSLDNTSSMDKWLSKLESSNWLSHVKDILTCACTVAQCIDSEGASVLVHGSEGFDTTLQVTSLVQLILDHDCRTINGFEALVEREWLQGGHPFADRCSKSAFAITKQRSESPVFLLFLDCVWQIWQQFPCSFEFNEEFLVLLFEHTYSSQFGTFLCNNEKERKECKWSSRTVSLWTYLARPEVLQKYLNPMYDPNPRVIWPSVAPQSLVLWSGLYQRSIIDQSKQKEAWQEVSKIREYDKELRSKVTKLRRQLASLEREALGVGLILPSELGVDCIPE